MKAVKKDQGKPHIHLIPTQALEEIASVLEFGAQKYGKHNWANGFDHSRLYDAICRHLFAYQRGEDLDPESGLNHLAHAGCGILFLLTHVIEGIGEDDRFKWK